MKRLLLGLLFVFATHSWAGAVGPAAGDTANIPLLQQDLIGNTNSYYPGRAFNNVIGRAPVVNNTRVDMWEGPTALYVFPTTGQQMSLVSTSANDAAAGSGIQTIFVHALDSNYNPVDFTIALNGTTPVLTTQVNLFRINGIHAATVGSVSGVAAGDVSITNVGGTVTYGRIITGNNTARQAIFTIPAGKTGYLTHWQGSSGSATGTHFTQIAIRATQHIGIRLPGVFLGIDEQGTLNGGISVNYPIPIKFPEKTDIKMSVISDAANAAVISMGAMFGWIE